MSTIINGATYQRGTVVTCDIEDDTPMFGQIIEIIVTPQNPCILVVTPLITIAFRHHFHAYEVLTTDSTAIYHHGQLFDYHPLVCTKPVGNSFLLVSTKYHLFS